MTKHVLAGLLVGSFLFVGLQCNLFGVFAPTDHDRMLERYGPESLILEGKLKMREGKWQEAYDLFHRATLADSIRLSEAWFYKGKCILRLHNVDLKQVWGEINPEKADKEAVPFLFHPPQGKNLTDPIDEPFTLEIHGVNDTAYTLVDSVFLERKRVYDAISQAVKCLERIHYDRYNMMDGRVTRPQYESDYLIEISVKSILGIIDHNHNDTLDYHSDERDIFRIMCSDIPSLDSMDFDSLKTISKDPKEINGTLELILGTVQKADTSYENFHNELARAVEENPDAGLRADMGADLGNMIADFETILPYFYYDDRLDNDGDSYDTDGNGLPDRMIWIDWDFDDKIDIDQTDQYHIGDPAHMAAFPQHYTMVDTPGADYQRYRYTGGYTFEFIAGDWGVDEEVMDGEDNDGDGLTDEDTRIVADTLDDDGDSVGPDPMIWCWDTVGARYDDGMTGCGDLLLSIADTTDPGWTKRETSYKGTTSTVWVWTGGYRGEFLSGSYGLDEEFFDGIDNDGDGRIDEDVGERIPSAALRQYIIDNQGDVRK